MTLAMIEAAAIDSDFASPPMMVLTGQAEFGARLPSTRARPAPPKLLYALRHRPQSGGEDVVAVDAAASGDADADARDLQDRLEKRLAPGSR